MDERALDIAVSTKITQNFNQYEGVPSELGYDTKLRLECKRKDDISALKNI